MDSTSVLIVTDIQNDFLPGGALAVADGNAIIPLVNDLARRFKNVVITQDWHPAHHISFASSHPGKAPFDVIDLRYGPQVLWPDHCIQGSFGAALADGIDIPHAQMIIRKGYHAHTDSYSSFFEADRKTPTGLTGYLFERGIEKVYAVGLATDFCVSWTAQDARAHGFETVVIEDACRAIDTNDSLAAAIAAMDATGVRRIASSAL
ncbi:bifunctional nicotinamidase/pyrazinamidase [Kaistia algarum]|uniref:bifunctional nicotinamidase/pyrazinamidase n=1 Tax=Kaistia algarum TaxID=2083279 RepID=UPI000CE845B0|nr:bifunctional nicotinamidase/pyrazinamidase [Kaistia algarum]MCX5513810.1 bifunctional nicotinamidase/pyrazinamidase [Kaistia algarum]PPE79326.1 bifunctional nicotinamidase/pyrazinamidase [Kaistia algarum]